MKAFKILLLFLFSVGLQAQTDYTEYFKNKGKEIEELYSVDNDTIFTDIDSYSSDGDYLSWGEKPKETTINIHFNYSWYRPYYYGWYNPWYNPWYNGWYYPYYAYVSPYDTHWYGYSYYYHGYYPYAYYPYYRYHRPYYYNNYYYTNNYYRNNRTYVPTRRTVTHVPTRATTRTTVNRRTVTPLPNRTNRVTTTRRAQDRAQVRVYDRRPTINRNAQNRPNTVQRRPINAQRVGTPNRINTQPRPVNTQVRRVNTQPRPQMRQQPTMRSTPQSRPVRTSSSSNRRGNN